MAFHYSLEKLLQLRQQQQSEAARQLVLKQQELERCRERLQALERSRAECDAYLVAQDGLSGAELELLSRRSSCLAEDIEKMRQICQKLLAEVERQSRLVEKAVASGRSQERHREHVRERWSGQEKKKEQRQQEELTRRNYRPQKSEVQDE